MIARPIITVYCDVEGCKYYEKYELTFEACNYGHITYYMFSTGWEIKKGKYICPNCRDKQDNE